jgi:MSHA biogenesis protein MshP
MMRPLQRARGFALILALFLIVSLAAVGAYMITVSNVQVETGVMDEQGARAYQAARAGLEWGAYQVLRNSSCLTQNFALTGNLTGFRTEVACTAYGPETEGAVSVGVFRITATGCNAGACTGGGATYVERQLQLTVTNSP